LRNSVQYGPLGRVFAPYGYVSLKLCRRLVYALAYNVAVTVSGHASLSISFSLKTFVTLWTNR